MATKKEDIIKLIGDNIEGGYSGLRKQVENAVEASQRPTSVLKPSDPISEKVNPIVQKAEEKNQTKPSSDADVNGTSKEVGDTATDTTDVDVQEIINRLKEDVNNPKKIDPKKEKREKLFASIGDALGAFHTAYSHARGVEPIKPGSSLSGNVRDRYEKLRKEYSAENLNTLQKYLSALQLRERARAARELDKYREDLNERKLEELKVKKEDKRIAARKQEWLEKYQQGILDDRTEKRRIDEEYKNHLISQREHEILVKELNARANWMRANGYTTIKTGVDKWGNTITTSSTTMPNNASGATGGSSGDKGKGYGNGNDNTGKGRGY